MTANQLRVLARKYGYLAKHVKRASIYWKSLVAAQRMVDQYSHNPNGHLKSYKHYLKSWVTMRQENPQKFFQLDTAPFVWRDNDGKEHPIAIMHGVGTSYLANEKGEMGETLAEIGVPADADLFFVRYKTVLVPSYEKV